MEVVKCWTYDELWVMGACIVFAFLVTAWGMYTIGWYLGMLKRYKK